MTSRAVWTIGIGQCVSWGVLYYAFGVLLVPIEQDLGAPRWIISGAFSSALLASAFAAPSIGKLADRGHGPAVMQAGGLIAAGLLGLWATVPTIWSSYAIWTALGLCMAAILYEPVFAIVGRAIVDGHDRLRAIATITVLGGLASTVFWPLTGWLVESSGWRAAVYWLASCLAIATIAVHRWGFGKAWSRGIRAGDDRDDRIVLRQSTDGGIPESEPDIKRLLFTFACSSFASSALATNLVAALIERRLSATTAATIAGLFGVMQLPGRLLIMNGRITLAPAQVVWSSLALQVAGLAILISATTLPALIAGVTLFACGSGLATVARPYVVLFLYGAHRAGHLNGLIARGQQLARAAGPVAAAMVATAAGYSYLFAVLAGVLVAAAATVIRLKAPDPHPPAVETT